MSSYTGKAIQRIIHLVDVPRRRNHGIDVSIVLEWQFLQNEVFYERLFFEARIFSRKMLRNFPEFFEPLFCGSEKFPQNSSLNFPQNFPPQNQNKIHRRASAGAQGEHCLKLKTRLREPAPGIHYCLCKPGSYILAISQETRAGPDK